MVPEAVHPKRLAALDAMLPAVPTLPSVFRDHHQQPSRELTSPRWPTEKCAPKHPSRNLIIEKLFRLIVPARYERYGTNHAVNFLEAQWNCDGGCQKRRSAFNIHNSSAHLGATLLSEPHRPGTIHVQQ
eukprot:2937005-Amphidinium_carterae.1